MKISWCHWSKHRSVNLIKKNILYSKKNSENDLFLIPNFKTQNILSIPSLYQISKISESFAQLKTCFIEKKIHMIGLLIVVSISVILVQICKLSWEREREREKNIRILTSPNSYKHSYCCCCCYCSWHDVVRLSPINRLKMRKSKQHDMNKQRQTEKWNCSFAAPKRNVLFILCAAHEWASVWHNRRYIESHRIYISFSRIQFPKVWRW